MTGPRSDQDVQRALSAWMDEVAPTRPPVRLLEETFATTMRARQDGARPWNRIDAGRPGRSFRPGPVVAVLFAAILIIVAFAVAISGGAPSAVPRPAPSASQPVTNPATPSPLVTPSPGAALPAAESVTPDAMIDIDRPIALAVGGSSIWILAPGRIDEVDPTLNKFTGSAEIGSESDAYQGIAANDAGVWATHSSTPPLTRVDPTTRKVTARITAGVAPKGVLATADAVWVADLRGGAVLRVDFGIDAVAATVPVGLAGNSGPNWLASGLGSIWVDMPNNNTVARIDETTDTVQATITIPPPMTPCGGIAVGPDAVWVTGCDATTTMARIDPATNVFVGTTELGGHGYNLVVINGAPWVSVDPRGADAGYLARIDPATNTVDRVLVPGGGAFGGGGDIVVADGAVWVSDGYNNRLLRLPMSAFAP